jgi:hypothetical protein
MIKKINASTILYLALRTLLPPPEAEKQYGLPCFWGALSGSASATHVALTRRPRIIWGVVHGGCSLGTGVGVNGASGGGSLPFRRRAFAHLRPRL